MPGLRRVPCSTYRSELLKLSCGPLWSTPCCSSCCGLAAKSTSVTSAPFDLVVLLILSETVQGALIADDKSVVGGLIAAATLIALGHVVGYLSWRSKQMERFFEGAPRVLVRNGRVLKETLAKEQVTHSELIEALRREGCTSLKKVRFAVLENDGTITVGMRLARESKDGQAD